MSFGGGYENNSNFGGFGGGAPTFAAPAYNGGGFTNTQGDAAGSTPGNKRSQPRSETLTPVTIKQLSRATAGAKSSDELRVDGVDVKSVTLVGKAKQLHHTSALFTFLLDDSTGLMTVNVYHDNAEDNEHAFKDDVKEDMYVRVMGKVKHLNGQWSIEAYSYRKITDFNEVTFHLMETLFVHAHNTKGAAIGGAAPQGMQAAAPAGVGAYNAAPAVRSAAVGARPDVMEMYDNCPLQNGMTMEEVVHKMSNRYPRAQIMQAIKELTDEGQLYSTIDSAHLKSTNT